MAIIGCYWQSQGTNSSLTIETFDDVANVWLAPTFPATSQRVSGFSSVTNPTAADGLLISNALVSVRNSIAQAGITVSAIHEKTWSRAPQAQNWTRARGQQAATALTQMAKTEIERFGQANGILVTSVEDLPTNVDRGNFLSAMNALITLTLGQMNRPQKMALCIALQCANGRAKLKTTSNRLIRSWLQRSQQPARRNDVRAQTDRIMASL
jgi:hypothetical protein